MESNKTDFETWDDEHLELKPKLLRGIYGYGFENPSPIQKKAIIPIIKKNDVIAQAQSGTGKTGAFTISSLQIVNTEINKTQIIIMAPTRELSKQIHQVMSSLSLQMNVKLQLLIGGTSIDDDKDNLENNTPHIVIGCPGRVHDMLRRKYLKTDEISLLVLDEADEMLSSGFKEQIYHIFQFLNNSVQVGLFSATFPVELHTLTGKFMRDPIQILVKQEQLTLQGIRQYYVSLDNDEQKFAALKDLFSTISISQSIIYCNSINRTNDLYMAMKQEGYPVIAIHSNMSEEERKQSYEDFKSGRARTIICTDLFSRGIDVQQVSIVINFDLPKSVHVYIHRIGRSGRWGRKGVGINFITRRDQQKLDQIRQFYNTQVDELPLNFCEGIV
jgi:translation initiation factor 4A